MLVSFSYQDLPHSYSGYGFLPAPPTRETSRTPGALPLKGQLSWQVPLHKSALTDKVQHSWVTVFPPT